MKLQERIDNYIKETKYPRSLFIGDDERIYGTWIMGNNYKVKSKYYGGYPATYLKRIKGYSADVLIKNDSTDKAELYTVGAEIQKSSK